MTELPVPVPGTTSDTLMWADPTTVEPEALDQLRAISRLPWLAKLRVMPDVHLGKGATVGSVIAMRDAVSPAAVGVDIGCGMVAARTNLTVDDLPDSLHAIRSRLEELVPVGWKSHTGTAPVLSRDEQLKGRFTTLFDRFGQLRAPHIDDRETRALSQSGTLGGGNHFLELQADDTGTVWLMLHSGSRNIGKELADRHITEAKGLDHNLDLPDRDLAVFLAGTPEMDDYLHDLYWAQEYARLNRDIMMRTFKGVIGLTPSGRSGGCVSRPVARGSGQGDWSDHDEQQEASHPGAGRPQARAGRQDARRRQRHRRGVSRARSVRADVLPVA
ncbi:Putative uncharacterized protein [Propionibacterium freudenreichii subsp. freudenreichii]|uniref:3'-phosphate/5'-hydroxy nucleic acid ligase n=1 Tax=Propionibacterium freudenreichii subsp. freudenreichii TaxID=66712 RepID=A0A0B7NZB1_PROFF|nr:Putative uncharacterized protein [Propionibacterium freudenreichii subsp. freudenreichii]